MKGRELAHHLGFGDGLRLSVGQEPIDSLDPVTVEFREDYSRGVTGGMASGHRYTHQPLPEKPLLLRLFGWIL